MRQRVGLARAFALTPRMLLLDEPFGMLDSLTRMELQEVLLELWRQDRKTALMVTHDVDEALFLSDRVVMMTQGPEAKVGDAILTCRSSARATACACMDDPHYYELRERIIGFLEKNEPHTATKSARIETAVANALRRRGPGMTSAAVRTQPERPRLVVVGNGMVGHRFIEAAAERGLTDRYEIVVIAEENRLGLRPREPLEVVRRQGRGRPRARVASATTTGSA